MLAASYLIADPVKPVGARRAVALYTELAEQGDACALVELGLTLLDEGGVLRAAGIKSGNRLALVWFDRAARQSDPIGQLWLARMHV